MKRKQMASKAKPQVIYLKCQSKRYIGTKGYSPETL